MSLPSDFEPELSGKENICEYSALTSIKTVKKKSRLLLGALLATINKYWLRSICSINYTHCTVFFWVIITYHDTDTEFICFHENVVIYFHFELLRLLIRSILRLV